MLILSDMNKDTVKTVVIFAVGLFASAPMMLSRMLHAMDVSHIRIGHFVIFLRKQDTPYLV